MHIEDRYTPEITSWITKEYLEKKVSPQDIASALDYPVRSIITKLSVLGIYEPKTYRSKDGTKPVKKAEYVDRIADSLGIPFEQAESLEKANKQLLKLISERLEQ